MNSTTFNGPTRTDYVARNKEFFSDFEKTVFQSDSNDPVVDDAINADPSDTDSGSNIRVRSLFPTTHESRKRMYTAANKFVYNNSCTPRLNDTTDVNFQETGDDVNIDKDKVDTTFLVEEEGRSINGFEEVIAQKGAQGETENLIKNAIEEIENEFNNVLPPHISAEAQYDERVRWWNMYLYVCMYVSLFVWS